MKRYKTVDDYIAASDQWDAELTKIRSILTSTDLTEEVKWGAPCYTYDGRNVVGMAGFKSYFGLWFHQGALLKDDQKVLINAQEGTTRALRQWRMTTSKEIRPAVIKRYVKEAIQLVRDGKNIGPRKKKRLAMPPELKEAIAKNKTMKKKFDGLTPGKQREYAEYISSAKRDHTKQKRLDKIVPMIRAGVGLNDRYRC
jgi:uncharacterized protein YdeI (YjbR/CyaY-like superfamily)